ncbi:MAG: hypothetical protein IMZ69_06180, partial [Spirochaetes bacterium]|nr:hypothetical protein [Spirochaetota bacterium]
MSEWTNGKPFVVTAEQMKLPWCGNRSGKYFRCGFCGHRFKEGDTVCWVFTNNIPGAGGNPFSCADCGTDLRELRNKWIKMAADWKDT